MTLLEERRKSLCLSFARKAAASERYGSEWFPQKMPSHYLIRNPEIYREEKIRTERMRKNPLTYMRHELNKERNA